MATTFYPHGKLCICSVQKKEEGFEDYRYTTYLAAESLGFFAIRNPERNGMTQEEFELCLKVEYPVFIFLVGTVESEVVNEEFKIALEKCLPTFIFIKEKNGVIPKKTEKIISKLSRISYNYKCTTFSTCEQLYDQVCERLKSYILEKEAKRPSLQTGVSLAYRSNTELMKKATRQIVIYQKTSILLLGPRRGCQYETNFYKQLTEWLISNKNSNIEFVYVFDWDETVLEKETHAQDYSLDTARENFWNLYNQYQDTKEDSLNIRFSKVHNSVSYVIADTNLVFVIPIENERFSIKLPAPIMKEQEIHTLLDEITRKTTIIDTNKISEFYEGR